jgi:hypothetical protein
MKKTLNDRDIWATENIIGYIKGEVLLAEKRGEKELDWDKIIQFIKDHVPESALAKGQKDAVEKLRLFSVSLPVDNNIKIFADYVTKYFEWNRNDDLYKSKRTGLIWPQSVIYRMWMKDNEY